MLTAKQTSQLLLSLRACDEAREWAEGHTLRWAWTHCPRVDWLAWLAARLGVRMTPGARRAYNAAMAEASRAYAAAMAEASRAYAAAMAEASRAYDAAVAEPRRAYAAAVAEAWRAYNAAVADAYRAAVPYEAIEAAARGAGRA